MVCGKARCMFLTAVWAPNLATKPKTLAYASTAKAKPAITRTARLQAVIIWCSFAKAARQTGRCVPMSAKKNLPQLLPADLYELTPEDTARFAEEAGRGMVSPQ